MDAHELAVVPGVEQQQADGIDLTIPSLQSEAAFQGLKVSGSRLGLERVSPCVPDHDEVPGAPITGCGEWHFGQAVEGPR